MFRWLGNALRNAFDVVLGFCMVVCTSLFIVGGILISIKSGEMLTELFFYAHDYTDAQLIFAKGALASFIAGILTLFVLLCISTFGVEKNTKRLVTTIEWPLSDKIDRINMSTQEIAAHTEQLYLELEDLNWKAKNPG